MKRTLLVAVAITSASTFFGAISGGGATSSHAERPDAGVPLTTLTPVGTEPQSFESPGVVAPEPEPTTTTTTTTAPPPPPPTTTAPQRAPAAPAVSSDVEANVALGRQLAAGEGWTGVEWDCLYQLWTRESGWRTEAHNPSGAHGIPQALPGSKMGPGWETDAHVQISWGLGYIGGRYGTPCGAWSFFLRNNWY